MQEKQYIERLHPEVPKGSIGYITDVCLGHALTMSQQQILYLEDWMFIQSSQCDVWFDSARKVIESCGQLHKDFIALYTPLRNGLLASYKDFLFSRFIILF